MTRSTPALAPRTRSPVTVALVNDYDMILKGLEEMLRPYAARVLIVDMEVGGDDVRSADVVLFDTFASKRNVLARARDLIDRNEVEHVVLYTWDATGRFRELAEGIGVSDVVLKTVTGEDLVEAIEDIAAGRHPEPTRKRAAARRREVGEPGLSTRDWELLALLGLGLGNEEIAAEMLLGVGTVRTYVHRLCRKLGVSTRAEAAARASELGVVPHGGSRNRRELDGTPESVRTARAFVADRLRQYGADELTVGAFRLAVSELGSNAVAYGLTHTWSVRLAATAEWFALEVVGGSADPASPVFVPHTWTTATPDEASGRGLGIVRLLMDEIDADTEDGAVRVRCRRRRAATGRPFTDDG